MKYWTEQAIKAHLDGTFIAVNVATGHCEERKVPANYIPTHKASYHGNFEALSEKLKELRATQWLPEEEERLLAMRERGIQWDSIRKMLQRGERTIKEHYVKLCKERGIEPLVTPAVAPPPLTTQAKAEIVLLRRQGVPFAQIAEQLNRPTYQVMDYYNRHLASKRAVRTEAAIDELSSSEGGNLKLADVSMPAEKYPRLSDIIDAVCQVYRISKPEFMSQRRVIKICEARQVYYWIARKYTTHSFPQIGRRCGDKDHSTVMHGAQKIEAALDQYESRIVQVLELLKFESEVAA